MPSAAITRNRLPHPDAVALAAALLLCLGGTFGAAGEIPLSQCPAEVQATIRANLNGGELDEIKVIRVESHTLYLVEIDLRGFRDLKLHVSGSGNLRKSIEEIRFHDLPLAVRTAVDRLTVGLSRVDDVEKVVLDGRTQFHVEIKYPQKPDLDLVFDEDGALSSPK